MDHVIAVCHAVKFLDGVEEARQAANRAMEHLSAGMQLLQQCKQVLPRVPRLQITRPHARLSGRWDTRPVSRPPSQKKQRQWLRWAQKQEKARRRQIASTFEDDQTSWCGAVTAQTLSTRVKHMRAVSQAKFAIDRRIDNTQSHNDQAEVDLLRRAKR